MKSKFLIPLMNIYLWLASKSWGKKLLKKIGPALLRKRILSFMGKSSVWRREKTSEFMLLVSNLIIDIFSDPKRPKSVKNALKRVFKGITTIDKRKKWREKYGVAPAIWVIDFTNRCNLNCYGCYADSYRKGEDLSFEIIDQAITEFKKDFGMHFIVLSGGEPFLRWEDMARMAKKHNDVAFMVYTNGTLISKKVVAGLAELGNIAPCISVEGFASETDNRRGKGHFSRITKLMQSLNEAGVLFGFSATVTSENAGLLSSDEFIDHYIEQGCKFGWYFTYIPIGRNPVLNLMVSPEQRSHLADQVNKWRHMQKPIFVGDFWNDGWLTKGCIAGGRRYGHIDGAGIIKPCVFAPIGAASITDVFSGKSKYKSLSDVIVKSPIFRKFREGQEKIKDVTGPCLIIDHPEILQEIWKDEEALTTKSTPQGFFEGPIADKLDSVSKAWINRSHREEYLKGGPLEKQS